MGENKQKQISRHSTFAAMNHSPSFIMFIVESGRFSETKTAKKRKRFLDVLSKKNTPCVPPRGAGGSNQTPPHRFRTYVRRRRVVLCLLLRPNARTRPGPTKSRPMDKRKTSYCTYFIYFLEASSSQRVHRIASRTKKPFDKNTPNHARKWFPTTKAHSPSLNE